MSKAKLEATRELIKKKRYDDARTVLSSMPGDPTARKWLAKLDEIAPEQPRPKFRWSLALLVFAVVAVIAGLVVYQRIQAQQSEERVRVWLRLNSYCIHMAAEAGIPGDSERVDSGCRSFIGNAQQFHAAEVRACHEQSPVLDNAFETCLYREGIVPIELGILPP